MKIRYFASLRDQAGLGAETVRTSATTLSDLYDELRSLRNFHLSREQVKASLNGDWSDLGAPFRDGDEVVFIPPVAGG